MVQAVIQPFKLDPVTRALTLGTVGVGSPAAVAARAHALRDADHDVRAGAAESLGRLGATASSEARALVKTASSDGIGWVRLQAVIALGRISGDPTFVVPALVAHTNDPWSEMRRQVFLSLASYASSARMALPAIRAAAGRDTVDEVRSAAVAALRAVSRPRVSASP